MGKKLSLLNDSTRFVVAMFSALQTRLAVRPWTQTRGAHKKVVSSKTHMQDSPGKRLGAKKYENHLVKVGQIIYRQRGTKWYPGFGCGIGKDHTIYAAEPGYVKYYLDPFHPKRKFIGVAKAKEDVLPYPHFEPTVRRLGREVLKGKHAVEEFNALPRKVELTKDEIFEGLAQRAAARDAKKDKFAKQLTEFVSLEGEALETAAARLLAIDGHLRGGKSLEDARFYASYNYKYDVKLEERVGTLTAEEAAAKIASYETVTSAVDAAVMFDAKFNLVKNMTVEEISQAKIDALKELTALVGDYTKPLDKKARAAAVALIGQPCWTLRDQNALTKRFLKPILGGKNGITIQRMNTAIRKPEPFQIVKP